MSARGRRLATACALLLVVACRPGDPTQGHANDGAPPDGSAGLPREAGLDVLLITIDTLRADALGSYGNPSAVTPVLDRLAETGVRFERARAHNVVTLPSHATMLSGLLPFQHGVRDNAGFRFPSDLETLATLLAANGYRTAAFLSAFPLASRFGLDRGFDLYEDSFVDAGTRPAFVEHERPGAETVALARSWLAAGGEQPSFAWVHLYEPHFPYAPPGELARRFASDPYLGEVAAADAALAPLLTPLLETPLDGDARSDTLVVVTSDHGEGLGEHGEATHGVFAYESTLAVPLIVHQPRLLEPRVVSTPVRLIDLLPTLLDLVDVTIPSGLPGRSLVELAASPSAGPEPPPEPTYFEALSGQLHRGWAPLFGVVRDDWKYVRLPIPELYDLSVDPAEGNNLATREPERLADLADLLDALRSADPGAAPSPEDAETRERLQALGYLSGGEAEPNTARTYTEADDPKRLILLDDVTREIASLHAAGDLNAARALSRELLRRRPDMRMVLMMQAQIEHDLGNLEAAIGSMRRAFELYPEDTTALALLVSYLTRAGRAREAVELSAPHAARAHPDVELLLVRALALARADRPTEAASMIDRARELDPTNPMVAVHRGTLLLMEGRRGEARGAFEEALAQDPATVRAHTSLAVLDTEEGRLDDAVEHWSEAVRLEPRQLNRLLTFGMRLWEGGNPAAARPLLELFVASAPSALGPEAARVRSMLDRSSP